MPPMAAGIVIMKHDVIGPEGLTLSECLRRFLPETQELNALLNLVDYLRMEIRAKEKKLKKKRGKPRDFSTMVKPLRARQRPAREAITIHCKKHREATP